MSILLAVTLIACFASVALISGAAASALLTSFSPDRRRLRHLAPAAVVGLGLTSEPLVEQIDPRLRRLPGLLPRSPKRLAYLRRRLTAAGFPGLSAVAAFGAAQLLTPLVLGGGMLLIFGTSRGALLAVVAAVIGYVSPGVLLSRRIERRKLQIQNGLPDALDLLTVCVEAGSGLDQAIVRVTDEVRLTCPPLADELWTVSTETRAGKARIEAFRDLAERTGVDDVRGFVGLLTQTDRFGTSIAQALRTHSASLRTKRRQHAEERAAKIGAKLAFPLVLFLFPALYILVLGPAAIQFLRIFQPLAESVTMQTEQIARETEAIADVK